VAFLIDRLVRGQAFMRVTTFLPIVVSGAVIAVLWKMMYDPTIGPFSVFSKWLLGSGGVVDQLGSRLVGAEHLGWTEVFDQGLLGNRNTAMPSLAFMSVWHGLGFNVLMYLVTLANIPNDLYEAAAVDGATRWGTFRHVTLPLLRPAIYLVTVLGAIGSLKVFGPMFIMTGGGPANSTVSLVLYIYQIAFTFGYMRFGYAAALAFLLAIVVLVFAITASRLNRPVDR
jgi:multiple sugar transport system permease protein